MSTIKRYQLLKVMSLTTHFDVEGDIVTVRFIGGIRTPEIIRGRFTTNDPALQESIEASKGFGIDYYLEKEEQSQLPGPADKDDDVPQDNPPTETDFPEILTVKDAREKLIELYPELKVKDLPNKIAVFARAKERSITFSKLV